MWNKSHSPVCVFFFPEFNSQMCQVITVQFKTHMFSSKRQRVELNLHSFVLKVTAKKELFKEEMGKMIHYDKRDNFPLNLRFNVMNATLSCISIFKKSDFINYQLEMNFAEYEKVTHVFIY